MDFQINLFHETMGIAIKSGTTYPQSSLQAISHSSRKHTCPMSSPGKAIFVVVSSSLVVTPAADMPREALQSRAKLVIINQGETPFDRVASLRFHERIGDVLPRAVRRLKSLIRFFE